MSATLTEGSSPQDVAAALAAAVVEDNGVPAAPAAPAPEAPPAPANQDLATPAPDEVDAGTPSDDDSLLRAADISLDGLTPEARTWLEAREREMQAVMTKRTQEAAEIRKQYEGLGDPDEVRTALGFYEGIRTDPNYAAQVYDFLTQNLTAAGYTPAAAAAKALQAMGNEEPEIPSAPTVPSFDDDPDEAVRARLQQLDERQRQIDARIAAAEAREQEAMLVNRILQQDNAIRQANPSLTDSEMDYIYQLAEATQGDLFQAHETYNGMRESILSGYIAAKEGVNTPVVPSATAPAELRVTPKTLDEGYAMGLERLRNELAQNA